MGAMSNYLEQRMINSTLRGDNFTAPAVSEIHLALFTADPTDNNVTSREISDAWYSRKPTGSWVSPNLDAEERSRTHNATSVTFDSVQAPAGYDAEENGPFTLTITHVGIYDSANAGNLLYHQALTTPKTLEVGDVISFAAGALILRLD